MTEPRIEIAELGSWGALELFAEYDPEDGVIRVNERVVERLRAASGAAEAARFVACAIAHERYHRAHPYASEEEARQHAAAASGVDRKRLESLLLLQAQSPRDVRRA